MSQEYGIYYSHTNTNTSTGTSFNKSNLTDILLTVAATGNPYW